MERADIIKLVQILSANYRKWPEEGKEDDVITLWDMMLSDLPLPVAKSAIQYHLSKSVYPPTVADIRAAAARVSEVRTIDWFEAWEKIGTAIRRFGSYRESEAIQSLPEDVARMVKHFTWRELCLNENIDTLRAQFRMAWETMSKRKQEQNILPPQLMDTIEEFGALKRLM
jgi:hypothetical protein